MALGKIASFIEGAYRTFQEEVAGALDAKEYSLVECGSADNSVKLNTGANTALGVMWGKLQQASGDKDDVNIRMLGKGGTTKVIQSGSIGYGVRVVVDPAAPTKVKALPATAGVYRVIGKKVSEGGGANNDVIEIEDEVEIVHVASADSLTALTFSATVTNTEAAALRDAVKAILQAHGLMA